MYIYRNHHVSISFMARQSRMDVVPERGLVDLIESTDVKEKKVDTSQVLDKEETDVWQEIADALNTRC